MPKPSIDLHAKIREILSHRDPLPLENSSPIFSFEQTTNAQFVLIKYIDDHVRAGSYYEAVYDGHMALQRRMSLAALIEAFERFLKEIAAVCVDHLAPLVHDDRFDVFSTSGTELAAHFHSGSIGKAMCESEVWLSNRIINERFRQLLKPQFGELWEFLFPNEKQQPAVERNRARTLAVLWQIRHTITHNIGMLTEADTAKLRFLTKGAVASGKMLAPSKDDLRYVKRFLFETAQHTNDRIAARMAELLTAMHQETPSLFDALDKANGISQAFRSALVVDGKLGSLV